MVHVIIDGIPVEVEKGTTILHAAKKAGIEIPQNTKRTTNFIR